MNVLRSMQSVTIVASAATLLAAWLPIDGRAQVPDRPALGGVWTLNKDLSDQPPGRPESGGDQNDAGERGGRGAGRGGGRRGGGGFGGGGFGRGMGRGDGGRGNAEEAARVRDAIRDITEPPAHLTITQTETMVVLTGPDGRTTRLSPDGHKVKDENTKIERKTKWEGGKLVSEILGPGKMTQTFSVDPEHHQLRITVLMEGGGRSGQPRTIAHVYDSDAR